MDLKELTPIYAQSLGGEAGKLLKKLGLPDKKNENYKYTRFAHRLPEKFQKASPQNEGQLSSSGHRELKKLKALGGPLLAFNHGHLDKALSSNIQALDLVLVDSPLPFSCDPFELLNRGGQQGKVWQIHLPPQSFTPLLVIAHFHGKECWSLPQIKIQAGAQARAHILECYFSDGNIQSYSSAVSELHLEEGAQIEYIKGLFEDEKALHVGKFMASLQKKAQLHSLTISLGASLARNNLEIDLHGEDSEAHVHGLFALREEQHHDNFSLIHHHAPHTSGHQVFKGLIDDQAHGVFTGKILIGRKAKGANSGQLNKNLLLSNKAHVNTQPQLEVYTNDVQCTHGATSGQISEEEIFYLQSRGIPRSQSTKNSLSRLCQRSFGIYPMPFSKRNDLSNII